MNTFALEGKVSVITGGLGGYGLAIAELMIKRGAKVLLTDVRPLNEDVTSILSNPLKAALEDGKSLRYSSCDVTKEGDIEAALKLANQMSDVGVEILINAAGIVGEQNWQKLFDVNINGVHFGIQQAFKHMKNGGVVVNISSTAGLTCIGDMNASPAYVASKHAITALTRTYGTDLYFKRHRVRVIAVAPYFIETALNEDSFAKWTSDEEALQIIRRNFEGKQMMKVEEAALKLINVLNAKNGSVWLIKPQQMQPFNVPDYVLPKTR